MIKVWCEECEGRGVFGIFMSQECSECNGYGYTECENNSEDLELAQAIKKFCERDADKLYYYDYMGNETEITLKGFIDWYREQKGENNE